MIRLSRLSDYAIVLMCEMASSRDETFSARKLHETTHISQSAIMKILKLLAIDGLVISARGARGGYSIASEPGEISILDIVKAIDGPVSVTLCTHNTTDEPCAFEAHCAAKSGWGMVNLALQDTLSRFSIADFLASHAAQHHKNTGVQYDFITQ
jgi:FeS assembly SUF system regulator